MQWRPSVAAIVIAVLSAGTATASEESAWQAYLAGRYQEALAELRPLAEGGSPEAQYRLGTAYSDGLGVQRNYATAASWFERAAAQGHPEAEFSLGFLYLEGAGEGATALAPDPAKAASWLDRAAARGNGAAQALLCTLTQEGHGIAARNSDDALRLCVAAANRGSISAQHETGVILASRSDVASRIEAYKWFLLAADKGYLGAADNLNALASRLNAQEIASAESAARAWKPRN